MAIQDYLTLSHLRKVVAAITQRIVGVENSVSNVENDVSDINRTIEQLRNDKEVFIITIGGNAVEPVPSATFQEILTAMSEGKIPVVLILNMALLNFKSTTWNGGLIFADAHYAILITENDEVVYLPNEISISYNSTNNKWEVTPFDYIFYMPDIFNYLRIYNSNSDKYYEGTLHEFSRLSYIDYETGDTVIFTNTDSSVNEWTRTIKPGSYSISRSSDTLTLTGSDGSTSTAALPSKTSDLTNDSGFMTGMTILSYGTSTWADFIDAYTNKRVVYCRASSASNSATGSQTRLAFMAFVNDAENPTNVEFQYYRSVNAHSMNQQGDQVYIYKLDKNSGWTVTVRECYTKVVAGTGLTGNWASGAITLGLSSSIPVGSMATPQPLGTASAGSSSDFSKADHVHALPTLSISSNVITLTGASGQTTSITLPVYNGGVSSS